MWDLKESLMAMVQFVYLGEANVYQENLDFFCFGWRAPAERSRRKPNCERVGSDFAANKPESPSQIPILYISSKRRISIKQRGCHWKWAFSENANSYSPGKARICNVCGKEGDKINIINHIEANHIDGISTPCGLCGQVFRTRAALRKHKTRHHLIQ